MKKEQFFLNNALVSSGEKQYFHHFSIQIYKSERYGILCDSVEERHALLDFFDGCCEVQSSRIRYDNREVQAGTLPQLFCRKIAVIQQKSRLIDSFSIAENVMRNTVKDWWEKKGVYEKEVQQELDQFGLSIDLLKDVRRLSEKERILVELLKAYAEKKDIVVLADFSSELRNPELDEVYAFVTKLKEAGMTLLILGPFGDMVFDWSDHIIIVKNRTTYGCFDTDFIDRKKLYPVFSYRDEMKKMPVLDTFEEEKTVLEFQHVFSDRLTDLSFRIAQGEVLKILCLDDRSLNGIEGIFMGENKPLRGTVLMENQPIEIKNIKDMRRKKICYCAPLSYRSMLIPDMTVRENIMIELEDKMPGIWARKKYRKSVDDMIFGWLGEDIGSKTVHEIPYYQRQQLVYMKLYLYAPKLLICSSPFFDTDLHMKEITKKAVENFCQRGTAVIFLTRNTMNLSQLDGDVIYLKNGSEIDEEEVYRMLYQV